MPNTTRGLPHHGLPVAELKQVRRRLVVALQNEPGQLNAWQLMEIADIQQVITAMEAVAAELDDESKLAQPPAAAARVSRPTRG